MEPNKFRQKLADLPEEAPDAIDLAMLEEINQDEEATARLEEWKP